MKKALDSISRHLTMRGEKRTFSFPYIFTQVFILCLVYLLFVSCQKSIEDRAEREAREYTAKYCPTPVYNYTRTDSMTFERATRTYIYYTTLTDRMDDSTIIANNQSALREALVKEVRESTSLKIYKDAGINFKYVLRSEKNPDRILFTTLIRPKDYQ